VSRSVVHVKMLNLSFTLLKAKIRKSLYGFCFTRNSPLLWLAV